MSSITSKNRIQVDKIVEEYLFEQNIVFSKVCAKRYRKGDNYVYCCYQEDCPYQSFRKRRGKRICLWKGLCNQQEVR